MINFLLLSNIPAQHTCKLIDWLEETQKDNSDNNNSNRNYEPEDATNGKWTFLIHYQRSAALLYINPNIKNDSNIDDTYNDTDTYYNSNNENWKGSYY
jgi:hypothetical protein